MIRLSLAIALVALSTPALAVEDVPAQTGTAPDAIDILVDTTPEISSAEYEQCKQDQEAATISGEIVVCRNLKRKNTARYSSDEEAETRYATATMDKDNTQAPDMEPYYPGIVVGRGCFIPPCPPPKAYIVDVAALPEAPPGSDADRIARGLAPRGNDAGRAAVAGGGTGAQQTASPYVAKELGLPPTPEFSTQQADAAAPAPDTEDDGESGEAGATALSPSG